MPPKFIKFSQFLQEYQKLQQETLDRAIKENRVVLDDEEYDETEDELEQLMEKEEWEESEIINLISLLFGIAYANRVRENEDG